MIVKDLQNSVQVLAIWAAQKARAKETMNYAKARKLIHDNSLLSITYTHVQCTQTAKLNKMPPSLYTLINVTI